ncbi:MAG: hypothetical protein K2Y16_10130 [Burkholderiales bacterium]|nr:hypothetical protein [Burkholderiales bacterium]
MKIILYIFSALFFFMALAVMFAFHHTRHYGLFLIALAYGAAAGLALVLMHWWPLVAGFALAWAMKLLGLEPKVGEESTSGGRSKIHES